MKSNFKAILLSSRWHQTNHRLSWLLKKMSG